MRKRTADFRPRLLALYGLERERLLAVFAREAAPARGGQRRRLLEATGEVRLMREAAVGRDLGELLLPRQQLDLRFGNLALEQVVLGGQAEQLGEAAVEVERGQVHLLGDLAERRAAVELLTHEFERGDQ